MCENESCNHFALHINDLIQVCLYILALIAEFYATFAQLCLAQWYICTQMQELKKTMGRKNVSKDGSKKKRELWIICIYIISYRKMGFARS